MAVNKQIRFELKICEPHPENAEFTHSLTTETGTSVDFSIKFKKYFILAAVEISSTTQVSIPILISGLTQLMRKLVCEISNLWFVGYFTQIKAALQLEKNQVLVYPATLSPDPVSDYRKLVEAFPMEQIYFSFELGMLVIYFLNEQIRDKHPSKEADELEIIGSQFLDRLKSRGSALMKIKMSDSDALPRNFCPNDELIWVSKFILFPAQTKFIRSTLLILKERVFEGKESDLPATVESISDLMDEAGYLFVEDALIDCFKDPQAEQLIELYGWPRFLDFIDSGSKARITLFMKLIEQLATRKGQRGLYVFVKTANHPRFASYNVRSFFYQLQCRQLKECMAAAFSINLKPAELAMFKNLQLPDFSNASFVGTNQRHSLLVHILPKNQ